MDIPQILTAIGVDDDRRFDRWRLVLFPEEEVLSIAFECDFDKHDSGTGCPAPGARNSVEELCVRTEGQFLTGTGRLAPGAYSKNCPIRRNLSRRRRTSFRLVAPQVLQLP